jgi:hypothetical protein
MHRSILMVAVIAALAMAVVGVADAFQCPKLVSQVNAAAGNRFDAAASEARSKAAQADQLHKEGKHAEAEKAAKEGLDRLGIKS